MGLVYQEWHPRDALRGTILAFWSVVGDGASVASPTILPDAYVEVVMNLGDPVILEGSGFAGRQPARAVVGLLDRAIPMRYGKRVHTFGIRLHPARAAAFLGVRAAQLANTLTPLGRLAPHCDARIVEWLGGNPQADSAKDRAALEALLADQCRQSRGSDQTVVRAVDQLLAANNPVTVAHLARALRITPRHLYRKFVAHVGTAPKRLERLARFARTWQAATMGPTLGWAELAYAHGYADQAHLVREFRAFGATPPTHLFTPEWYEATTVQRVTTTPHEEVRSVQSSRELPDPRLTHQPRTATAGRKRSRST